MPRAAPRIDVRLLEAVRRVDDGVTPMAEVNRRVGLVAEALGLTRPSYEQVRVLVHRARRDRLAPTTGEILLDIAFRVRPPDALVSHLSGVGVPKTSK